ncbi:hypothetical protein SAMN05421742_10279 [Roseospirillum parvum]|uniref:Uncharacterized protein n=1 Tax=Roseospirillum parvum TaxID=83401 RepID=A0A1G7W4U3_9PROT|nr:hypothetical protein SAMN05421742_10279 [Roseospirillum parvum]
MPSIFEDERRGTGPIAPNPFGAGPISPLSGVRLGLWWGTPRRQAFLVSDEMGAAEAPT